MTSSLVHDFGRFPGTRYQGSKRKLATWIVEQVADLEFNTVLDAFGGTGCVAYAFKCAGKQVTYNDVLSFNYQIGLALIENDDVRLTDDDIRTLLTPDAGRDYPEFIQQTFQGIYFTDEENRWLDRTVEHLSAVSCRFKRALGFFGVFQAAIAKRPYNLFHRKNLYMRTADVERGFGNKTSWDRSFDDHFRRFAAEANRAVFDNGLPCRAMCRDVLDVGKRGRSEGPTSKVQGRPTFDFRTSDLRPSDLRPSTFDLPTFDLVYIDTPYISSKGVGVDYRGFYHFLEGLVNYERWPEWIDHASRHRRLTPGTATSNPWTKPDQCGAQFQRLFHRFRDSVLVVSYRSDGIPTIDQLVRWLRDVKRRVRTVEFDARPYVLSTNRKSREVLLIAT